MIGKTVTDMKFGGIAVPIGTRFKVSCLLPPEVIATAEDTYWGEPYTIPGVTPDIVTGLLELAQGAVSDLPGISFPGDQCRVGGEFGKEFGEEPYDSTQTAKLLTLSYANFDTKPSDLLKQGWIQRRTAVNKVGNSCSQHSDEARKWTMWGALTRCFLNDTRLHDALSSLCKTMRIVDVSNHIDTVNASMQRQSEAVELMEAAENVCGL